MEPMLLGLVYGITDLLITVAIAAVFPSVAAITRQPSARGRC